jgi:hypothetical protein
MAELAESVSERTSAAIDATTEPDKASDPGASGGQVLRHVSHTLSLEKDKFRPSEKRDDAQEPMESHGTRYIPGVINGYLSPGTHLVPFKAVMRDVWSDPIELDETDLISAAIDATAKTITFGGGNPVTLGLRVGMVCRFSNLATAGNNGRNVLITGFSGANSRVMSYYSAGLVTETADTAFGLTAVGGIVVNKPTASTRTQHKVAIEVNNPGPDISRFYSECKFTGFDLSSGVNANVTLNFNVMGRNREILSGSDAPFFTAPAAETTTDIATGMHGVFFKNGVVLGVSTAVDIKVDLAAAAAKAQNPDGLIAGINLSNFTGSGSATVFLTDTALMSAFDREEEMSLLMYFPENKSPDAEAVTLFAPRIKIGTNTETEVDKSKALQISFTMARYFGTDPGVNSTTLQICDTLAAA